MHDPDTKHRLTPSPRAALLLFAVTVRIVYALVLRTAFHPLPDEEFYDEIARNLLAGQGYVIHAGDAPSLYRPPGYPLLLAGVFAVSGGAYAPVYVLQTLFDLLTLAAVYTLGRGMFGERTARLAVALCALYPFFSYYSVRLLTESGFTLLLAAGLLAWWSATRSGRLASAVAAGIALGAATLFRFSLFPFLLPAALAPFVRGPGARPSPVATGRRIACSLAMPAAALAVLLPWTARNYAVTGRAVLLGTGSAYNLWLGNHVETGGRDNDELTGPALRRLQEDIAGVTAGRGDAFTLENERRFAAAAREELFAHPGATAGLVLRKAGRFWFSVFQPGNRWLERVLVPLQAGLLALAAAGAWLAWRRGRPAGLAALAVLYFNGVHALSVATYRYCLPVMPVVLLFGAYAAVALAERTRAAGPPSPAEAHHA